MMMMMMMMMIIIIIVFLYLFAPKSSWLAIIKQVNGDI